MPTNEELLAEARARADAAVQQRVAGEGSEQREPEPARKVAAPRKSTATAPLASESESVEPPVPEPSPQPLILSEEGDINLAQLAERLEEVAGEVGSRLSNIESLLQEVLREQKRPVEAREGKPAEETLEDVMFDKLVTFVKAESADSDGARNFLQLKVKQLKQNPSFADKTVEDFRQAVKAALEKVPDLKEALDADDDIIENRVNKGFNEASSEASPAGGDTDDKSKSTIRSRLGGLKISFDRGESK